MFLSAWGRTTVPRTKSSELTLSTLIKCLTYCNVSQLAILLYHDCLQKTLEELITKTRFYTKSVLIEVLWSRGGGIPVQDEPVNILHVQHSTLPAAE